MKISFFRVGLLSAMLTLSLIAIVHPALSGKRDEKKVHETLRLMEYLKQKVLSWHQLCQALPISLEAEDESCKQITKGLHFNFKPDDRWGHPFEYKPSVNSFRLTSFGKNGKPGGILADKDIVIEVSIKKKEDQ